MEDPLYQKRLRDLESSIQETLELIKQYEDKRRLACDPKERKDCERHIDDLRHLLSEYQAELSKLKEKQAAEPHDEMEEFTDRWHKLLAHASAAWAKTGEFLITRDEFIALSEYFKDMDLDQKKIQFMLHTGLYYGVKIRQWVPRVQSDVVIANALIDVILGSYWRPRWRAAVILSEINPRLIRNRVHNTLHAIDADNDAALALRKVRDASVTNYLRAVATDEDNDQKYKAGEILWQMGIAVKPERAVDNTLDHECGLQRLQESLAGCSPKLRSEFNTLEARLLDNLHSEQLYGSTDTTRAERSRILKALNDLTDRAGLGSNYNDLCRK